MAGANLLTAVVGYFGHRDLAELNNTWEGRLTGMLGRLGRVVAVGRPGEERPPVGARRFYLPDDRQDWQCVVTEKIRRARLVVVVAAISQDSGAAAGTLWEYTEAVRLLRPSRVVLVVFGEPDDYERFRARANEHFAARALPRPPELPDWPEPLRPRKRKRSYPFHGVVRFDDGWAAEFVHFDATAQSGLTPHARWRRTVRGQVDPWLEECERALPGDTLHPARVRVHWHLGVIAAGFLGWLGTFVVQQWETLDLPQQVALPLTLVVMLGVVARLAALTRAMSRDQVSVRLPDDRTPVAPLNPAETRHHVTEEKMRGFGVGFLTARWYFDENENPVDAPRRRSWRTRTRVEVLARSRRKLLPGIVVSRRKLRVVQTARDAGMTSHEYLVRALMRLAGVVGYVVGTSIGVFRVSTLGQQFGVAGLGLFSAAWLWFGCRKDFAQMNRMRLYPNVPADLAPEPGVLYLRPHPDDDPHIGLEGYLKPIFTPLGLFRAGYVRGASPPPPGDVARLPLSPDDWQATLVAAFPHCEWVVMPATGTSAGTVAQVESAVRLVPPSRLALFLLNGDGADEDHARFRVATEEVFARRGVTLPDPPPLLHDGGKPLRGVIHFADDWTPFIQTDTIADDVEAVQD